MPARSYSAFFCSRSCATRAKFTSNTECTWADVRRLSTMCSAIFFRITPIGTISTRSPGLNAGTCAGATAAPALADARGSRGCRAWSRGRRRRSRATAAMSTLCSLAMRRTSGDDRVRRASSVLEPAQRRCRPETSRGGRRFGPWPRRTSPRGLRRRGRPAADVAAATVSPIVATTLLTATVSPSRTLISDSTPAAGEGISASTLSVEISKSGSSRSTVVAHFLDPADDGAFGDRLAHLRHQHR